MSDYEVLSGRHNWISFPGNQLVGETQDQCQWPIIWITRVKGGGGEERGWKVIHKLTLSMNRLKNLSNKFKLSEKKLDINFVGWKATSRLYFTSSFRLFDANVNIYLRNTYPFPSAGNFLHNNWLVSAVLKLCKQIRGYMSEHQTTSCYVSSSWGTDLAKMIAKNNVFVFWMSWTSANIADYR